MCRCVCANRPARLRRMADYIVDIETSKQKKTSYAPVFSQVLGNMAARGTQKMLGNVPGRVTLNKSCNLSDCFTNEASVDIANLVLWLRQHRLQRGWWLYG